MKPAKRHIVHALGRLGGLFPLRWLSGEIPPLLPFYHAIGDAKSLPHIKHLYRPRNEAEFRADMEYISKHFEPVDMPEFVRRSEALDFRKAGKPIFHLSFDDGLRQVYEVAMPLLEKMGIPATIFVNPDFVDNKALFFRYKVSIIINEIKKKKGIDSLDYSDKENAPTKSKQKIVNLLLNINNTNDPYLKKMANSLKINFDSFLSEYRPYMTKKQLSNAIERGFSVGAHSMNHPYYYSINQAQQIRQTKESITWVQKTFSLDYKVFAFPFTDFGVKDSFFEYIFSQEIADATFACAGIKKSPYSKHWQRLGIEESTAPIQQALSGAYLYSNIRDFLKQ